MYIYVYIYIYTYIYIYARRQRGARRRPAGRGEGDRFMELDLYMAVSQPLFFFPMEKDRALLGFTSG